MTTYDVAPPSKTALAPNLDMHRPKIMGALSLFILIGVLGTWASFSMISGAIVTSGQAVVQGKPKVVQTLDGGEVAEILVRDGDTVEQGAVLIRLDATLLQINLDIARTRLASALALQARLTAEQLGQKTLSFTYPDLPFTALDTARHEQSQQEIFNARAAVLTGQQAQLEETLIQLEDQSSGNAGQITALKEQINLLERDLENMRALAKQGLARQSQMSEIQRTKAQVTGQLASLEAERARLANARRDATLSTLQATRGFQEEVVTQLRDVTAQIDELTLEIITRRAQLARIDVIAPAAGVVHQMQVTTKGGVVAPGGEIARIIPSAKDMDFKLRVDPRSIDQVFEGQAARLMVTSFDPQTSPHLDAHVATVSPDVIPDPRNGQPYYEVSLELTPEAVVQLSQLEIMPGMPVEAYLETGDRSVLSYLVHPITSQLRRAMRE